MEYDQVLWNDNTKISREEYFKKYSYLFNKEEYLSEKLKKYNLNSAKIDLKNGLELSSYHGFIAKTRDFITGNITVYKLRNDLINIIQNIDIQDIVNEPPVGLKNPLIIESNDPKTSLFGDIKSIVLYYYKLADKDLEENEYYANVLFLTQPKTDINWYLQCVDLNGFTLKEKLKFRYAGGNLFSFSVPTKFVWSFNKIDYKRNVLMRDNYCERCACKNKCEDPQRTVKPNDYVWCYKGLLDNIFSFILLFLYLLEAKDSPIETDRKTEKTSYTVNKKGKIVDKKQDWYIKYLYLNNPKTKPNKSEDNSELDKDGLISKLTWVKGHYRYQACGPGLSEHKLIPIKPHLSSRWSKDNDTKIITGLNNSK